MTLAESPRRMARPAVPTLTVDAAFDRYEAIRPRLPATATGGSARMAGGPPRCFRIPPMGTDTKDELSAARTRMGAFAKAAPGLSKGFTDLSKSATAEGRFTAAQKELIATAIAVAEGCEDCILHHVDGARRHGADEADLVEALEALEALEVAVEMGGGPALMRAGKAPEVFRTL